MLIVNVAGSLILGVLLAEEWSHPNARLLLHDAGGIGFGGSLTTFSTFSTFSVEVVNLARVGSQRGRRVVRRGVSRCYVAAVVARAAALRRVRAVMIPLEEQP